MFNYQALSDELTEGFMLRMYLEKVDGVMRSSVMEDASSHYRADSIFHNRVQSTVAAIILTVQKYELEEIPNEE